MVYYCLCSLWMDVGGVGYRLLWCDFEAFLHQLCHCQIVVNDLVCLLCVYLMFSISCRISSTVDRGKMSSRSKPRAMLADMVMT